MIEVYLGLGSNLDNPFSQIQQAIQSIALHPEIKIESVSSFYTNPPMGPNDQPDYLNAVMKIVTEMPALELLDFLKIIEKKQNRKKKIKWGPRTIDLDILLYGKLEINLPNLIVPHEGLTQRAFVVWPLLEIAPNLRLPNKIWLKEIAQKLDCHVLTKIK